MWLATGQAVGTDSTDSTDRLLLSLSNTLVHKHITLMRGWGTYADRYSGHICSLRRSRFPYVSYTHRSLYQGEGSIAYEHKRLTSIQRAAAALRKYGLLTSGVRGQNGQRGYRTFKYNHRRAPLNATCPTLKQGTCTHAQRPLS